MGYTNFEYSVSLRRHSTSPLTAELTCTEVLRKKFHLSTDETNSFFLPEQTILNHTSFIPLNEPNSPTDTQNDVAVDIIRSSNETTVISRPSKATNNYSLNCTRISEIMRSFGVTGYACTSILREIDMVITSSSSRGRGVIEIKIWKIKTEIYEVNRAAEKLMIESCCSNSLRIFGYNSNESTRDENDECVICMEDYTQGSLVTKLPCNHDFHGVCIYKWLNINHVCPLCRSPIPKDVQFQYQSSFGSIFRFFSL